MKARLLFTVIVLGVCSGRAHAQYAAVSGNCELPGQAAVISGISQSGTQPLAGTPLTTGSGVMASYPQCLVTVYPAGSSTPVATGSVYSNATGTALGNPFTANTDGSWTFYVVAGCYDVLISSGTPPGSKLPASKTLSGKCAGGGGSGGGGLPTAPQTGDTVCYNCNGDSAWDAVNYARPFQSMYAINQTATLNAVGVYETNTVSVTGSTTDAAPTATLQSGKIISASASASTNTVLGATTGSNGNTSLAGMLAFYRWSARMSMGNTTNVRYWQGLACYNNSGTGSNGTAITASAAYASDTPNKSTIAFMYDPAINTHWQAVAITAGASSGAQTTVDTGVVEDTAIHLFEMTTNSTGTSVTFWIDGTSVATISTNLPPPANGQNSAGQLFFTGDNKNTATAIAETFYSMQMALKQ